MKIQELLLPAAVIGGGFLLFKNMSGMAASTPAITKPADTAGVQPKEAAAKRATPEMVVAGGGNLDPGQMTLRNALVAQGVSVNLAGIAAANSTDGKSYPASFLSQVNHNAALGDPDWVRLSDVGGVTHTGYQWNYYRTEAGGNAPGDPLADMSAYVPASLYIAGIQGMDGLGLYTPQAWKSMRRRRS